MSWVRPTYAALCIIASHLREGVADNCCRAAATFGRLKPGVGQPALPRGAAGRPDPLASRARVNHPYREATEGRQLGTERNRIPTQLVSHSGHHIADGQPNLGEIATTKILRNCKYFGSITLGSRVRSIV